MSSLFFLRKVPMQNLSLFSMKMVFLMPTILTSPTNHAAPPHLTIQPNPQNTRNKFITKKHKNRIISHQQRTENTPKVIQNSNSDNSAKEQKVLPFCFLPRAQARLRLLRLASCHRSTAQSLLHRCEMMSSAAKEAKCSRLVGMDVRRCLGSWWLTGVFVF